MILRNIGAVKMIFRFIAVHYFACYIWNKVVCSADGQIVFGG